MSFGLGFGSPFGGGAPVATSSPISEVAAESPIAFDFTDEPNGPLPGTWEFFILTETAGVVVGTPEPDPTTFFRVQDSLGLWKYLRQPAVGDPFQEQGVAASPTGIIQGRNAELAIAFVPPPVLLDSSSDEFFMEVTAGLRMRDNGVTFVGARATAAWAAGVWTIPIEFEVIHGPGMAVPVVLSSATFDFPNPEDPWNAGALAEVRVELRGTKLIATLSGAQAVLEVDPVPVLGDARPLVMIRVFNRLGTVFTAPPSIAGIQFRTLRDAERLGPAPSIEGHEQLEAPLWTSTRRLRIRELEAEGFIKQTGGRIFEVKRAFEHNEAGVKSRWNVGNIIRVTEPVQNQFLMPVVPDLAHIRGVKERKA